MGSLGIAESHFILEETGRWGVSFSRSISSFPNAPSTRAPSGSRETPPGFLQTPAPPSKPCSGIPLPWGLSLTSRPDESSKILPPLVSLVHEQTSLALFPKSVPSGLLSGTVQVKPPGVDGLLPV